MSIPFITHPSRTACKWMSVFVITCLSFATLPALSAGLLKPKGSGLPDLEMTEHHVQVSVDGTFITTSIEQIFHNPNNTQLEAIYSFPVPEAAAVGEFTYWIDGQPVVGEVVEKKRAREIYQQEKEAGREAALVEKDEYKTFDIHVTPVLPNSDVRIRLVYIQSAYVDASVGRYVYPLEEGGVDEVKQSFWSRNEVVTEKFSFKFHLRSAYPVDAMRLPAHSGAQISQVSDKEWHVSLLNASHQHDLTQDDLLTDEGSDDHIEQTDLTKEAGISEREFTNNIITLDQDVVVYWRLKEGLPGGVDLVAYKENESDVGTFMMTLTPGDDLSRIQGGRDWLFVLDTSGSMDGKYASLAEGMRQAMTKLNAEDRFHIVTFNNGASDLTRGMQHVSEQSVRSAIHSVSSIQPSGGTNLYAGLERAVRFVDQDRPVGIVLVTDGVANVGVTEKAKFLDLLQQADVRLFTFVMGNSANRPLLEEMTDVSSGFAMSVSNNDDMVGLVMQATSKLNHHAMRNISFSFDGVRTTDVIPEHIQSLYRGEQLVIFGHYYQGGKLNMTLNGVVAGQTREYTSSVILPDQDLRFPEVERLWGYSKVEQLTKKQNYFGEGSDTRQAMVDTAIQYGLVTDHTSMIVLREEVFAAHNIARGNKDRVAREHAARDSRHISMVQSQSVSQDSPAYSAPRSSTGGGGAFGLPLLMLMLGVWVMRMRRNSMH